MRAGRLTEQIALQVKTLGKDEELSTTETWSNWRTVWAECIPKTGREYFKLQTTNSEVTDVFAVRHNSSITPHMRVKYKGRDYDIIDVMPVKRNVELWLTCKAVV